MALEEAMSIIENNVVQPLRESNQIGGLYDVKLSGAADDLTKLRKELFTDFNLAILLTYLLLTYYRRFLATSDSTTETR